MRLNPAQKLIGGLILLALLFAFPPTRRFIVWALPLGLAWDDLAFWVLLAMLVVILSVRGIIHLRMGWLERLFDPKPAHYKAIVINPRAESPVQRLNTDTSAEGAYDSALAYMTESPYWFERVAGKRWEWQTIPENVAEHPVITVKVERIGG